MAQERRILAINSGSSSLKFALYALGAEEHALAAGELQRIGQPHGDFTVRDGGGKTVIAEHLPLADHHVAVERLLGWLAEERGRMPEAVGHRLVHGGARYDRPLRLTSTALAALRALVPLAPQHLPQELSAVEATARVFPQLPQVACFDTAFHAHMPQVAQLIAVPRQYRAEGIRRYGFHGLSYEYIVAKLAAEAERSVGGRLIVAHLGNGASMAAIRNGQSIETTMGFTPAGGLVMSTRTGDLDPGVLIYLMREHQLSAEVLDSLVNRQAGLLGVSGVSADMRDLQQSTQADAEEAIELFCYAARKSIGAFSAVLGGLDTLVFTGGIGEHAPTIRQRICAGLDYLGIHIDETRNAANGDLLSPDGAPVMIRRVATNEELMIARHTAALLFERT